ncbi:secretion system protein F [Candidatus Desantisbacteria bacterium CG07_land_8_20_14_0_80_39_15]|uniref:Secretion system protein F n=2 Tax=unclassified Candidatus Desantisiibacteriota TaxID=3106372 RepID=A0A2H9PCS9_9BACT|nr:MAG: secretion system protein F [Candidatus Desantisbacteria bacterium CG07_land_8_20_14_0_80_39_15]PIZ17069.1 MAG: secretion system protein F [Candidatus Desantisbacteria bacterium CG_4_10_14_0_8_um_filter_39_17]
MAGVILLLTFGAVFVLCFEFLPEEMSFSRVRRKNFGRWIIYKIANINGKWFDRFTTLRVLKGLGIENFRNGIQKKLNAAGSPFGWNPDEFLALKELLAVGFFSMFWLASKSFSVSLVLLIVGFFLPDLWLNESVVRRKRKMVKELPYFIDILTFSVEAGLDFAAAINKIVQKSSPTPLIEELIKTQEEIRVGRTRENALHNLAKRVDIPEISSFTSALIQADNMGSPLGTTLRTQSEQMHLARFLRAEKKAQEAPVKMLFPLIIFIFPVIFIVLFGPVILQLLSQ